MSVESHEPERGAGAGRAAGSALDTDILEALAALVKRAGAAAHSIAAGFGVAPPDLLAMFKIDGPLAMKELAQRMGVDASFVTSVADALERRGFVRREPDQRDRRVKNLVLTPEGVAAKKRLLAHLAARMPWCYALDDTERRCFLELLRKMLDAPRPGQAGTAPDDEAGTGGAQDTARSELAS